MSRLTLPSPALCVALLALFISLGGTTYAITALPRDSVGTEQIRARAVTEQELSNAAVTSRKLATGAVTERKIGRNAITGSRIAPDSIAGAQIDESSLLAVPFAQDASHAEVASRALVADRVERVAHADTADTAREAQVADHATDAAHADQSDQATQAGQAAVADSLARLKLTAIPVNEGEVGFIFMECAAEPGLQPISGGYLPNDPSEAPVITGSFPLKDLGWALSVREPGSEAGGFGWVLCAKTETFDDS